MTRTNDGRDTYEHHTEFRHEAQHLEAVVSSIDVTIQHKEGLGPVYAGSTKAARIAKDLQDKSLTELRSVRKRPYFGRIDYSTGVDGEIRSIYIGEFLVRHKDPRYHIVSRNAPIARLYYRPADGFYDAPKGTISAQVQLKRILQIEHARLLDFDDVLRLPTARGLSVSTSSAFLDERLSDASGDRLSDAVQTIQPEQYEQIAATQEPVLVVQGAAGSGKSLIGLHRIDFHPLTLQRHRPPQSPDSGTGDHVWPYARFPGVRVSPATRSRQSNECARQPSPQWLLNQFSSRVTLASWRPGL